MTWKKRLLFGGAAAFALGIAAFTLIVVKDRTYVASPAFTPTAETSHAVAVVYYSRSGHSEAVAREAARLFDAPIARIDADYPRDISGQRRAVSDAKEGKLPYITVEPLDLSTVRRLYLVSPTWMFRPATPLWAYVAQTDLTGKEVILVTTGNSRFEQSETDAFARAVEARGGRLVQHVFLRRGRIFWQKSREELLLEARARLGEQAPALTP
ncbi:flavodoxin family protein [Xanthomonas arboricola]|uniref:flavodoxin family protein n=1 Tax=Xanthomonas arboricola TaxID=56448 RepID=UPI0016222CD3|nr:flavodoxin/nitric oxide synthase [Xanthomonas arboricola]MBB4596459.1 hypothetical protein [Xanthomonas arboricola]